MKKFYITGGDNCYCCECGGVCDRHLMLVDTKEKTLRYIPFEDGELCLGKFCWFGRGKKINDGYGFDGWTIERTRDTKFNRYGHLVSFTKYYATNGVETMPVVVKNNKWGKDSEFGSYGSTFGATYEPNDIEIKLVDFIDNNKCVEYFDTIGTPSHDKPKSYWFKETGWKLVRV